MTRPWPQIRARVSDEVLARAERKRQRMQRNLNPHRDARLAMLVWGAEYSRQNGGSMDFYDSLSDNRKRMLRQWCDELDKTPRA